MSRGRVSAAALLLLLTACSGPPQRFSRGDRIPMAKYTLSVTNSEDAVYKQNARALIVYLRSEPIADRSESEAFQAGFLASFRLRDGSGRKYVGTPIPASAVRSMRPGSTVEGMFDSVAPEEWGVLFPVPEDAARFTLHIINPSRQEAQPAEAVVDLGR